MERLKVSSIRKDIVVIDGGIHGLCAAIAAAREGANVALIVNEKRLGGLNSPQSRYPLELPYGFCFPLFRESGIYDEVLTEVMFRNQEGTFFGFSLALDQIANEEERLSVYYEEFLLEVNLCDENSRIDSILTAKHNKPARNLHRAKYFIDCSIDGKLGQMSNVTSLIASEVASKAGEGAMNFDDFFALSCVITVAESNHRVTFAPPRNLSTKWEDNAVGAKLDLMESLKENIIGDHLIEWNAPGKVNADQVVWSAWDYLKNRSPVSTILENFYISDVSSISITRECHRGKSVRDLKLDDVIQGVRHEDSVAISRSPPPTKQGLIFSSRGKKALPYPIEIPLSSLRSKKLSNLFWIGNSVFAQDEKSFLLPHVPTLSQMAIATGVSASLLCERKSSFYSSSFFKKVRGSLARRNHLVGMKEEVDANNLVFAAEVSTSSTLVDYIPKGSITHSLFSSNHCLLQIPILTNEISKIEVLIEPSQPLDMEIKLLAGSSYNSVFPGKCLHSETQKLTKDESQWIKLKEKVQIDNPGWHFLEFKATKDINFHLQENSPFGIFLHRPKKPAEPKLKSSFSDFIPLVGERPKPNLGPFVRIHPIQNAYSETNLINRFFRPNQLPNLWISQSTNFKYPEFIELKWEVPVTLRSLEITFDSSMNFQFPPSPVLFESRVFTSLVKEYNIYYTDDYGHSHKLTSVIENRKGFQRHIFDEIKTSSIEIEIVSTHGLDRAQVYQVRAYA